MSIIDLSHLFSTLYAGLKLGKEPKIFMIWKKDTMEELSLPRCTPVSSSEETGEAFLVRQHSHSP